MAANPRPHFKFRVGPALLYGGLLVGVLVMLYPLVWMVASSFKPGSLIFSDLSLWPSSVTLENYVNGWAGVGVGFGRFFTNSLVICAASVVGNLVSCSMAAFAFARLNFRFKRFWFAVMLLTIMLPFHVTIIPQYVLFHRLGWIDTYLPLIVPKFLAVDAFFIFLMVQFIRGIPRDLDQAAMVDGANVIQVYWGIILPLLTPALITTAIFTFIWTWNDFFGPLLYLNEPSLFTVSLGLRLFLDATSGSAWGPMFAMSTLALVPVFVIFLVFQRFLIEGIATSGLKG